MIVIIKNMSSPSRFNNIRVTSRHKWMIAAISQTFNIEEKTYKLDPHIEEVTDETIASLKAHYRKNMYRAMLTSTKSSLNALKKRLKGSGGGGFIFVQRPFFELDVTLAIPTVALSPSLDEVQRAINKASQAVLKVSKRVYDWGQNDVALDQRITNSLKITLRLNTTNKFKNKVAYQCH